MLIRARDEANAVLQKMSGQLGQIEHGLNGLTASAAKLGGTALLLRELGAAVEGAARPFASVVKAASDLTESVNKAEVVFGSASASVIQFSQDSAKSLGLSQQAAIEALGTFGNLFTSMQIGPQRSAAMSTELVKLASDLASFNNISVDDALQKLEAGLVGEIRPLRDVGVNLTEEEIKLKAVSLGLAKVGDELTPAGKALAAYALIFEQTHNAQGDFIRTSDELANTTRTVGAQFKDLQANVGEALKPLALDGARVLSAFFDTLKQSSDFEAFKKGLADAGTGIGAFINDVQGLSSGGGGLNALDAVLTAIADRIGRTFGVDAQRGFEALTGNLGDLASELGTFVNSQVVPAVTELRNLGGQLESAAVHGTSFSEALGPMGAGLDAVRSVLNGISEHREVLAGLATTAAGVATAFLAFQALSAVIPIVAGLAAAIGAVSAAFAVAGTSAGITALVTLLGGPLVLAIGAVALAAGLLVSAWAGNWGDIQTKAQVAVRFIGQEFDKLGTAADQLPRLIGDKFDEIGTRISQSLPVIKSVVDQVMEQLHRATGGGRTETAPGIETSTQQRALAQMQDELNKLDPSQFGKAIAIITKAWADLPESVQADAKAYAFQLAQMERATKDTATNGSNSLVRFGVAFGDFASTSIRALRGVGDELTRIGDQVREEQRQAAEAAAKAQADAAAAELAAKNAAAIASLKTLGSFGGAENAPQGAGPNPPTSRTPLGTTSTREHQETAIEGFMAELIRNTANFAAQFGKDEFGKLGAELAGDLAIAIAAAPGAAGGAGQTVARTLDKLVTDLHDAGIPEWRQLGDDLARSYHDALISGLDADKQAAIAKTQELVTLLQSVNAFSPESFLKGFNAAQIATQLGSGGAQIMDALDTAIKEGGVKNIESLGKSVESMRVALLNDKDLSPERAAEVWAGIFAAINAAVKDGTANAADNLREFLAQSNLDLAQERIGTALATKVDEAAKNLNEQIKKAGDDAAQQIQDAVDHLEESRTLRAARENVDLVQAGELKNVVDQVNVARQAWHDFRDQQHLDATRAREDADLERTRGQEDADLVVSRAQRLQDARRGNQPRGTPVASVGAITSAASPIDDLLRGFAREDAALAERRKREDAERARRREEQNNDRVTSLAERFADAVKEQEFAKIVDDFKREQLKNLRVFTDAQEDIAQAGAIRRIGELKQKNIAAAEEAYDKAEILANSAAANELRRIKLVNDAKGVGTPRVDNDIATLEARNAELTQHLAELQQHTTGLPALPTSANLPAVPANLKDISFAGQVAAGGKFDDAADKLQNAADTLKAAPTLPTIKPEQLPSKGTLDQLLSLPLLTLPSPPTLDLSGLQQVAARLRADAPQGPGGRADGLATSPLTSLATVPLPSLVGAGGGRADQAQAGTTGGQTIINISPHVTFNQNAPIVGVPGGMQAITRDVIIPQIIEAIESAHLISGGAAG